MDHSAEKSYTLRYGAILAPYWMCYAVLKGFASFFFLELGFSNTVIGGVMSISDILAALIQPILANWADQEKAPPVRRIVFGLSLLMGILIILSGMTSRFLPSVCLVVYAIAIVVMITTLPFLNALGMETLKQKRKIRYGASRAIGSLGYGIASYSMGLITLRLGAPSIPIFSAVFAGILSIFAICYPLEDHAGEKPKAIQRKASSGSVFTFFKRYPKFMLMLLGMVLVYVSHSVHSTFLLQIIRTKGGDSVEMGLCSAIAVVFEIIPMLLFGWFREHFRLDTLIKISVIAYFIKILLELLVQNMAAFYLAQFLQTFAWGFSALFLVLYTDRIVNPEDSVKGQAFAATSYTISGIIGSYIGGRLIDAYGVNPMLLMGTVISGIGVIVVFFTVQRERK